MPAKKPKKPSDRAVIFAAIWELLELEEQLRLSGRTQIYFSEDYLPDEINRLYFRAKLLKD